MALIVGFATLYTVSRVLAYIDFGLSACYILSKQEAPLVLGFYEPLGWTVYGFCGVRFSVGTGVGL